MHATPVKLPARPSMPQGARRSRSSAVEVES
jgi:hypothetical protein